MSNKSVQKRLFCIRKYVPTAWHVDNSVTYLLGTKDNGTSFPVIITNLRVQGSAMSNGTSPQFYVWAVMTKQAGISVVSPSATSGTTLLTPEKNVMLWSGSAGMQVTPFFWVKHFDDFSLGERKLGIKDNLVWLGYSDGHIISSYFGIQFFEIF
jgi:hypothetical protein